MGNCSGAQSGYSYVQGPSGTGRGGSRDFHCYDNYRLGYLDITKGSTQTKFRYD